MIPESVLSRLREKKTQRLESKDEYEALRVGDQVSLAGGIYTVSETQYRMDCGKWNGRAVIEFSKFVWGIGVL